MQLRAEPAGWVLGLHPTRSEGLRALRWQGRRQAEHRDPHRRRPQGRAGSHGCLLRLAEGDAPTSSGNSRAQVTDMSAGCRLTNPNRLSNISGALHPERCGGSGRGGENSIATAGSLTANLLTRPRADWEKPAGSRICSSSCGALGKGKLCMSASEMRNWPGFNCRHFTVRIFSIREVSRMQTKGLRQNRHIAKRSSRRSSCCRPSFTAGITSPFVRARSRVNRPRRFAGPRTTRSRRTTRQVIEGR